MLTSEPMDVGGVLVILFLLWAFGVLSSVAAVVIIFVKTVMNERKSP